jgi:E3 ubiquitin-protein ligase UBR7
MGEAQPEGDEEDDEARVLIPSDTYDGLICSACVEGNQCLREQRGKPGWITIVPEGEAYRVIGRPEDRADATEFGAKRERADEEDGQNKRVKLDEEEAPSTKVEDAESSRPEDETAKNDISQSVKAPSGTSKGDIFLVDGIREKLQAELDVCSPPRPH